jgi:hypothetical protein
VKKMTIRLSLLLCLTALVVLAVPASGQTLYGATAADNGPSDLFTLNPATGALASTIGPIGFSVTGLAFNPLTGVLYGATGTIDDTNPHSLITINTTTGAGTLVGSFSLGSQTLADITFTSDGTLYGWAQGSSDSLATVNLATGAATVVGASGLTTSGSGIAADASDTIYFAGFGDQGALDTINRVTGAATFVGTINGTAGRPINALAFNPVSGVLYGVVKGTNLVTIDKSTAALTVVGATVDNLDAIVFSGTFPPTPTPTNTPIAPTITPTSTPTIVANTPTRTATPIVGVVVPTLSFPMLGLLGLALAAAALVALKRF